MQPNGEPSLQPYLHAFDAQGRAHRSLELPAQPPSQMSETYPGLAEGSRIASKDAEDLVKVLGRQLLILQVSQAGISSPIKGSAVMYPATVLKLLWGFCGSALQTTSLKSGPGKRYSKSSFSALLTPTVASIQQQVVQRSP